MAVGYPPQPVYPDGIDSDYTLFLVYNTTESELAEDNQPWDEEVVITPRGKTQTEIWADNGFANINGELFYYDSVEKDSNGKVYKLKRCARNLGGTTTQFNSAGTMVRGFVVAEHHNQLVDGIILTEQFIGEDFSEDEETLDWRIRNLQGIPIIFDDFGCPDINFFFTTKSIDPSAGTVVHYKLEVTGSFNEFSLAFGDGTSTSSIQEGDHTYPPNANIDPVVTFKNNRCQVVQTPISRDSVDTPAALDTTIRFDSPNSPVFNIPNITVTIPDFPEAEMTLPPFQFPCIDLSPLGISPVTIPSVIMFEPPINLPSMIDFEPLQIPSFVGIQLSIPSILEIVAPAISVIVPDIPDISLIVPTISIPTLSVPNISLNVANIPNISIAVPTFPNINVSVPAFSNINVNWGNPPVISFTTPPAINVSWTAPPTVPISWSAAPLLSVNWSSAPTLGVDWGVTPTPSINWGSPPTVLVSWTQVPTVAVTWGTAPTVSVTWGTPPNVGVNWGSVPSLNVNWGNPPTIQVNVALTCPSTPLALAATDPVGLTDDIMGVGRDLEVQYDISGFPSEIVVLPPEIPDVKLVHNIPSEIYLKATDIPNLKVDMPEIRDIKIIAPDTQLFIEARGIPEVIRLESSQIIPDRIELAVPVKIPEKITIDGYIPDVIRIEGMPEVVRLEHNLPSTIKLEMPEKPEIELVYKGSPIPVQVQFDVQKLIGDQENIQCVAIVPCGKK